jgi:DNA-binding Lrp family transcriptional regulator
MKIELLNPYVIKILISLRKEDSISSISKRIQLSYGWTNKWVNELIKEGILKEKWRGVVLNGKNKSYQGIIGFIKEDIKNINFYYYVLNLFGIKYCFTKTDAVYVWTGGRYNIARYKEYYPVFIKIKKSDYPIFIEYCKKFGLKINSNRGVFYNVEVLDDFECVKNKNFFIEPLNKTINFMRENIYNFEPALEMIKEIYKKKLNIKYKEINYL